MIDKDKNKSSPLTITFPSIVPPIMKTILIKGGIGALLHFFKNDDKGDLIYTKPATNQVVNLPNNEVVTSYFKGQISVSSVQPKKHEMHMCSNISTNHP